MIGGHWTYCQYREYCLNKESEEQTKEYLAKEFDKEMPKAYPFLLRCQAELTIYASMIEHSAIAAYDFYYMYFLNHHQENLPKNLYMIWRLSLVLIASKF
jgi:hypothetical protein